MDHSLGASYKVVAAHVNTNGWCGIGNSWGFSVWTWHGMLAVVHAPHSMTESMTGN